MTILIREAPVAGSTTAQPDLNEYTSATLSASGRRDGAELRITLQGMHPDIRPARVRYQDADIGGDWVSTSVATSNRGGDARTEIVMRPALSRRPGYLLRQLHARLRQMLAVEYRLVVSAQEDFDSSLTSAIGYWGYILSGANAPAASVSQSQLVETIADMIEDSTLVDQERYDDAARALWGDWMLMTTGQLLQRWGLRSALSPVSAHRTAAQIARLPSPKWLELERGSDLTYLPGEDIILVPVRIGTPPGVSSWHTQPIPQAGDQAWLVWPGDKVPGYPDNPGATGRPSLATPDDAGYEDAYVVRGVKDGIRRAQLAGYLQSERLQLESRMVTAVIEAPETVLDLLSFLPGQPIRIDGTPMWVLDISINDLDRTARLTLVDPS